MGKIEQRWHVMHSRIIIWLLTVLFACINTGSSSSPNDSMSFCDQDICDSERIKQVMENVSKNVTYDDLDVMRTAAVMTSDYPGGYNINQISSIYDSLKSGWKYKSDPRGPDYFNSADLTLELGGETNSVGVGDCDDFAILMSALIEAIGGTTRIIFAYGPTGSHAYTEVYLGDVGDPQMEEIVEWLKSEYNTNEIYKDITYPEGEVWLNLDWWADHPGGEVYGTPGTEHCVIFIRNEDKTPPKMAPIIDAMDNTSGWRLFKDDIGSSINIESLPSRKGKAIEISYDLVDGGYVGISKEVEPKAMKALSEADGVSFSYWGMGEPNTIELRLSYEDNSTFGYFWNWATVSSDWTSRKALYENFQCLNSGGRCELYNNQLNPRNVSRIEFIISNGPQENDVPGSGVVVIDQVQGIRVITEGSPWALVEEMQQRSIALDLAARSKQIRELRADLLPTSQLLALESLKRYPNVDGYVILLYGLNLLPKSVAVMQHDRGVNDVAFDPNGSRLATGGWDGTARVWEVTTGRELTRVSHGISVSTVAFSPDGTKFATGNNGKTSGNDHTTRVWDAVTGEELARMEHDGGVSMIVFSPDGSRLATASEDGTARVWDVATGQELARMEHDGMVEAVAFSPDGTKLATGSWDDTARIWDATTGQELARMKHEVWYATVEGVAFSPDGTKLATASWDDTARIWDVRTGKELIRMHHDRAVSVVAFSPDGTKLATASDDATARVWDVRTGEELFRMVHNDWGEGIPSGYFYVDDVVFSPDGTRLATTCRDGTARVWDAATGRELARMKSGNTVFKSAVIAVIFSSDGTKLATASSDHTARVWDMTSIGENSPLIVATMPHSSQVETMVFSLDGTKISTASWNKDITTWNVTTGQRLGKINLENSVYVAAFNTDGTSLATPFGVWNTTTGKKLIRWNITMGDEPNHNPFESVYSITFNPNGSWLAARSNFNNIKIWDLITGQEISSMRNRGTCLAFSPDGTKLLTEDSLSDVTTGQELFRMEYSGPHFGVHIRKFNPAFSPDGTKMATRSPYDHTARVWDATSGQELARMWHDDWVLAVAFSPNGTEMVTGSQDGTARVWNLTTGQEIARIEHKCIVDEVSFSPDGTKIATLGGDKTVRIWLWRPEDLIDEACSRLTRNLTPEEWRQYLPGEPYCKTCPNLP